MMKNKYYLLLILLLGLLLRVLYIHYFIGFSSPPESHGYWLEKVAYNISQGNGFGSQPGSLTAKKPPLYPAFLAFFYIIFGQNFLIAKFGHIILALFTCLTVFFICKKILPNPSNGGANCFAVLASLILLLDPTYIYVSGWFLTENLCILLFALTIFCFLRIEKDPSFSNQIFAGFFLALTNLTRPNFISFMIMIPLWSFLLFPKEKALKIFLTITLSTLVFVSPWIIRNWYIYDGFIPIATGGGRIFLAGNNPEATGDAVLVSGSPRLYYSPEIPKGKGKKDWTKWKGDTWQNIYLTDLAPDTSGSGLSEREADLKYYRQGIKWIVQNPSKFLLLLPKKIYCFWQYWSLHTRWPSQSTGLKSIGSLFYHPFFILVLLGIVYSYRQKESFFTLYVVMLYSQISTLLFFGDARQRFLFLPFLAIFAAKGLIWLTSKPTCQLTGQKKP